MLAATTIILLNTAAAILLAVSVVGIHAMGGKQ
jgi:hypothetical protein